MVNCLPNKTGEKVRIKSKIKKYERILKSVLHFIHRGSCASVAHWRRGIFPLKLTYAIATGSAATRKNEHRKERG